jgi:hypothetical protein
MLSPKSVDEFVVCDAGGSTVNTTAYGVEGRIPVLQLTERKASDCKSFLNLVRHKVLIIV